MAEVPLDEGEANEVLKEDDGLDGDEEGFPLLEEGLD